MFVTYFHTDSLNLANLIKIDGVTAEMNDSGLRLLLQSAKCQRSKVKEFLREDGKLIAVMESEEGLPLKCKAYHYIATKFIDP